MRKTIIVLCLMFFSVLSANDKVYSYTAQEMHSMASSYIKLTKQISNSTFRNNSKLIIQSSEFRGYIASMLDFTEMFNECASNYTVEQITYRSATYITNNKLDISSMPAKNAMIAVAVACDDKYWSKK